MSHRLAAAASDVQQSVVFAPVRLLNVPSSTPPRPSGRKHHISLHLAGLAKRRGETRGLETTINPGRGVSDLLTAAMAAE